MLLFVRFFDPENMTLGIWPLEYDSSDQIGTKCHMVHMIWSVARTLIMVKNDQELNFLAAKEDLVTALTMFILKFPWFGLLWPLPFLGFWPGNGSGQKSQTKNFQLVDMAGAVTRSSGGPRYGYYWIPRMFREIPKF